MNLSEHQSLTCVLVRRLALGEEGAVLESVSGGQGKQLDALCHPVCHSHPALVGALQRWLVEQGCYASLGPPSVPPASAPSRSWWLKHQYTTY